MCDITHLTHISLSRRMRVIARVMHGACSSDSASGQLPLQTIHAIHFHPTPISTMTNLYLPFLTLVLTLCDVSNALNAGTDRRAFIGSTLSSLIMAPALIANAIDGEYVKTTKDFAYAFQPPSGFEATNKPLKTHLEEVNFMSGDTKGYQFGVTVDPVRITSLKEVRNVYFAATVGVALSPDKSNDLASHSMLPLKKIFAPLQQPNTTIVWIPWRSGSACRDGRS